MFLQQLFIWFLFTSRLASSEYNDKNSETNFDLEDEFDGHFLDPSAKAAMITHIEDMAFIEIPHGVNNSVDDTRAKRNAIRYRDALWPNAQVPYVISSRFSSREREVIFQAMRHWEDNTCIRFVPRTREIDYLYIFPGDGCYSYVGRQNYQPQGVSLGGGCVIIRTAIHELGHAIGFYHEHNRPDRDEYISVLTDNINSGRESAFRKYRPGDTLTLGYGYDYASIMHYHRYAFTKNGRNTIKAKDSGIEFGSTEELSPLDILKANALYRCSSRPTPPPVSTFPHGVKPLTLPDGITCGGVIEGKSGTLYSPSYPAHLTNQDCAWVIRVPDGYNIRLSFPNLSLEKSTGCSKDYVQVFRGYSFDPRDGHPYIGINGKFCTSNQLTRFSYVFESTASIYYHTDGNNTGSRSPQGLQIDFFALDIDECYGHRCHRCTNLDGSYRCECNEGYYHSPAAATCFDYNECAYGNGGCDHICDNNGGSYVCKCNPGYVLQADGLSCSNTTPPPPTPPPTSPPPPPPTCGGVLTSSTGALQTPKWPETYPFNFDCEWTISIPNSNQEVELTFDNVFGIAGKTVQNCPKDHLKIYEDTILTRTICDLQVPTPIRTNSSEIKLIFYAGPSHGPLRKGFKITYKAVDRPTIAPPPTTTVATTQPSTPAPTPSCLVFPSNPQGNFACTAFMQAGSNFGPENFPIGPITSPLSCQWTVLGSSSFRVRFKYFDIPNSNECSTNYVAIHDGFSAKAPMIEKMCGEKCKEYVVEGKSNIMTVTLEVTSPEDFRGFYAHFEQI